MNLAMRSGVAFMPPSHYGEVPEWSNGTDSKSVVGVTLPGVRIPPSPPRFALGASRGYATSAFYEGALAEG